MIMVNTIAKKVTPFIDCWSMNSKELKVPGQQQQFMIEWYFCCICWNKNFNTVELKMGRWEWEVWLFLLTLFPDHVVLLDTEPLRLLNQYLNYILQGDTISSETSTSNLALQLCLYKLYQHFIKSQKKKKIGAMGDLTTGP